MSKYSRITNKTTRWLEAVPAFCGLCFLSTLSNQRPTLNLLSAKNLKNLNLLAGLSILPYAYSLKDSEMIPLDKSNKPPIFLNILPGVQNNPITQEEGGGGGGGRRFLKNIVIFDL